MVLDEPDLIRLRHLTDAILGNQKAYMDLSYIEQGLLINELLRRKGVRNIIVKKDESIYFESPTADHGITVSGPANIIIVRSHAEV